MADYSLIGWQDEVTKLSAGNFAHMDAGIKDAAEHQNAGYTAQRPPADAAHKHHIWRDRQTGVAEYCDGTAWIPLSRADRAAGATAKITRAPHATNGETLVADAGVVRQSAWLIGTTPAGDDTYIDELLLRFWRDAGVTSGAINLELLADDGTGRPGNTVLASISVGQAITLPTARPTNASSYRILPTSVRVAPGTNVYLNVKRGSLTGGNVYIASGAGGNEYYEYQGGNPPFQPASAGSIGVTANTRPPLRVYYNPQGVMVGWIDDDGTTYDANGNRVGTTRKVTAVPATGYPNEEIILQNTAMANNGIAWRLRYNADSPNTHKWEFVGGSTFYARDPALVQTGFPTPNPAGPSHTIPATGFYEITMSLNAFPNGNVGLVQADLYDAANAVIDATAENFIQGWVASAGPTRWQGHRTALFNVVLTAGQTIKMGYAGDNNGIGCRFRSLGIKPVRVN